MKILLDMNLSPLWIDYLGGQDIEARHWSNVGNPRASDQEILAYARQEGFIVFSHDLDFSRLLALTASTGPSVIQLRSQTVLPEQVGSLVVAALRQHSDTLERGALVTVDTSKSRARILPLA